MGERGSGVSHDRHTADAGPQVRLVDVHAGGQDLLTVRQHCAVGGSWATRVWTCSGCWATRATGSTHRSVRSSAAAALGRCGPHRGCASAPRRFLRLFPSLARFCRSEASVREGTSKNPNARPGGMGQRCRLGWENATSGRAALRPRTAGTLTNVVREGARPGTRARTTALE